MKAKHVPFLIDAVAAATGAPAIQEVVAEIAAKYIDDVTAPKENPGPPPIKREQARRLKQMKRWAP